MTTFTEVRSASFCLVSWQHHSFANSFNFCITGGIPVALFHSTCIFCVHRMTLYWPTLQFYVCVYVSFVDRYVASLVSVITTLYYITLHVCMPFHWIAQRIFNKIKVWASSPYPRWYSCYSLALCAKPKQIYLNCYAINPFTADPVEALHFAILV